MKPIVYIAHRGEMGESPVDFSDFSLKTVKELMAEALVPFEVEKLVGGKRVFIKPNFVRPDYRFNPAVSSDPRAVIALGSLLKDAGAVRVAVGDNPGLGLSFREALKEIPGSDSWIKYGIEPFFYEDSEPVEIDLPEGKLFKRMKVPKALLDFDVFVNLPKIKMHMHVGASLGIKNLYGLLVDEQRMTFHRQDVSRKVVDILRRFTPDLTVAEGIWALEGQAPICGEPVKDFNTVIAGVDPVAVDAVGSSVMGIEPVELASTRLAHTAGLGEMNLEAIDLRGAPLEEVKRYFKRPVVSSMGAYPNCDVYELGACVGCMSSLRHALDKLHYGGELAAIPQNTYILGVPGPFYEPLAEWEGDLWLIGDCPMEAYGEGGNIVRVSGCPPHFGEVLRELKRKYIDQ
ncbi:MAG: DUF362 domain-containing protein [candidate division Zixibacteria bacterium]|nr:DUF362 domain-containing protein [Candidatus Tariuqbacter arcticus]